MRALKQWQPLRTPRTTSTLVLYVLGLYVAFYARAPVQITDAMATAYETRLREVDTEFGESLTSALREHRQAEMRVRELTPFMWRIRASGGTRMRIDEAKREARKTFNKLRAEERKRDEAMRLARSELGLWSDLGVGDAKALFKKSYERGKVFATRSTFWDGLSLMLRGKSDESTVSFFLRWGMIVLSNFTVGMISAIVGFAFALPSLIGSFSVSLWSATLFYIIALVSATAVVASILFAMYGTAAGSAYVLVKHAGPALARLDDADARRRQRIDQRAFNRRPHYE